MAEQVHYDYDLQVWIIDGRVSRCGHPDNMRRGGHMCCNGWRYAGLSQDEARQLEEQKRTTITRS